MTILKRSIATTLAVLGIASCMTGQISNVLPIGGCPISVSSLEAEAASGRLYNQNASNWSRALRTSGCGLFSMANAVYALNGKKMDMNTLASWAQSNGYWKPGNGGTYRDSLYGNITAKYGSTYCFKITSKQYGTIKNTNLINHLKNGGVAVAHVGRAGINGHFIAITGYNSSNGTYHVIDSVNRCAESNGDAWKTASFLSSTSNNSSTKVDWFALVSRTSNPQPTPSTGCFPKYTGSSGSIAEALKAVGYDGSYSYRKTIAAANGISNYSGTASQNTTMLNKLKAGTLKKPGANDSSSSNTTKKYFPKYTGSSGSIADALKAVGADSSYSYRKSVAAVNGISNYSGTAAQNTTMLNKLKAGNLIKP